MNPYSVTGCVVTHNNMCTIKQTIETLLQNTKGVDFKLYVVDNLSTDGTPEFIKENYSDVEVIMPGDNKGFGAGHNKILNRLNSKYHAIINPDISIEEDVICKLAEFMDENEDVGLASPRICFPEGKEQILGKRNPSPKYLIASRLRKDNQPSALLREYAMLDADITRPFDIENATGCFMFIRTELFKKLGGFDERYFMYFEDADLTRQVRKSKRAVFFPGATVFHVWGRDSKRDFHLMLVHFKSMCRYFAKWR